MNSVKALIFTHAAYLTTKNLSLLCLYVNSRVQIFCFLKMAENINQKHSRKKKKGYHINLREEQKAKQYLDITWLKIKI